MNSCFICLWIIGLRKCQFIFHCSIMQTGTLYVLVRLTYHFEANRNANETIEIILFFENNIETICIFSLIHLIILKFCRSFTLAFFFVGLYYCQSVHLVCHCQPITVNLFSPYSQFIFEIYFSSMHRWTTTFLKLKKNDKNKMKAVSTKKISG